MGYLGVPPQSGFITTAKQRVTSSTNNYVDLDHAISNLSDVIVWVNFVKQDSTNLSLTTSSRITLGATLVASDIVEIAYLGKAVATQTPDTGTVTNDMLAGSIANSKLANSSITLNGSAVSLGGSATISSNAGTEIAVAKRSGNQPSIANGVWTKINYNVDVYDADSNFDTSNYRYVAPSAGRYYFTATAYLWGYINTANSRFYKNGNAQNDTYFIDNGNYSGVREFTVRSNAIFDLAQNDYIEFYVKSNTNSGTTVADEVGTQFLAFRLD